jgi:hypothetical protein
MVRGIRNADDFDFEKSVAWENHNAYGIKKFMYFITDDSFKDISSSNVRKAASLLDAESFQCLSKSVHPKVLSATLEKVLGLQRLYMVVGPPGGGKSTILNKFKSQSSVVAVADTDKINHKIRKDIEHILGTTDLLGYSLDHPKEFGEAVVTPWLNELGKMIHDSIKPGIRELYLEIPYGLQPGKEIYRYVGANVLYIGCTRETAERRIRDRGTPQHLVFLDLIPDREQSITICEAEGLMLTTMDSEKDF